MTEILERTETNDNTTTVTGEFTTTRAELAEALATVGVAIATRPAIRCMGGVLLESRGTDLWVGGYDYDTAVTVRLADAVRVPGRMLLAHGELSKLLTALTKGLGKREANRLPVTVRAEDHQCATVELADSAVPMELLPIEDYPSLPPAPPAFAVVDPREFTAETTRVLRALGGDDTLPALTGMKIDILPDALALAATDRYRLAVGHLPASLTPHRAPKSGVLVHGASLGKLVAKLQGQEMRLGYEPDTFGDVVALESGPVTVTMRLHNGNEFVKYRDHLPRDCAATVVLDRAELLTQTQQAAAVLAAKGEKAQPVTLALEGNTVHLAPHLSGGQRQVRTRSLAATVTGNDTDMVLGLNHRFLAEAAGSFTGTTLALHIRSASQPVLLTETPAGVRDRTEFRHLIMPQRLSS